MIPTVGAVDYWCNAFTPRFENAWRRAIEKQDLTLKIDRVGDEFCEPAAMVERMDDCGFATLIVVACDAEADSDVNSFDRVTFRAEDVAALHDHHPGRFAGTWSVDPNAGEQGLARAEEMLAQPWCVGLHNHTHSWDRRFDHPDWYPFYELAADHDVPFVMQAGASGGDFPHACGHPSGISAPADRYDAVTFVLSHTGWPWTSETIAAVRQQPNVYVGTASWPPHRWPDELVDFAHHDGRGRVLFGSGFPVAGHRQAIERLPDRLTDPDVVESLLCTTARNVFTRLP